MYPLKYLKNSGCFRLISILVTLLMSGMFSSTQAEESQAVVFMYHHFGVNKYPSINIRFAQFDAYTHSDWDLGLTARPIDSLAALKWLAIE